MHSPRWSQDNRHTWSYKYENSYGLVIIFYRVTEYGIPSKEIYVCWPMRKDLSYVYFATEFEAKEYVELEYTKEFLKRL